LLIKLDENLGDRGRQILREFGHEIATVAEQGLASADDDRVAKVCQAESRCLVTLDLDFSNPFVFPPEEYSGIAVIRLPRHPTPADLFAAVTTLGRALEKDSVEGSLWIVERGRIRQYLPRDRD